MRKEVFDRLNNIYYFPDIIFDKCSNEDNLNKLLNDLFISCNNNFKEIENFINNIIKIKRKSFINEVLKETLLTDKDKINFIPGEKLINFIPGEKLWEVKETIIKNE